MSAIIHSDQNRPNSDAALGIPTLGTWKPTA
jgi:hypothetical protein